MKRKEQLSQSLTTTINRALLKHWNDEFTPCLGRNLDGYLAGDALITLVGGLQEIIGDYIYAS